MNCPKCSGHTATYYTKYEPTRIIRHRVCDVCKHKFTTTETYTEAPEKKPEKPKEKLKKERVNRRKRAEKIMYVKYDDKPPYLPIAVADSIPELAEILGVSRNVVYSSFSHKLPTYKEIKVYEGEGDEI